MRILVTGGAGFIGSHLVTRLLATGRDVRVLDNLSTGRRSNLADVASDVELIAADVRDLARIRDAMRGCSAVVHLAALPSVPRSIDDPASTHHANATGTLNVLVAARDAQVSRVVFASSSSIYGAAPDLPKRESLMPLPISPYAVSKLAAENYCRSFFEVYGLETVALRYFNVFGPRQDAQSEYAAVIPRFIQAYRDGTPPVIFGDGEQSRDFTYRRQRGRREHDRTARRPVSVAVCTTSHAAARSPSTSWTGAFAGRSARASRPCTLLRGRARCAIRSRTSAAPGESSATSPW